MISPIPFALTFPFLLYSLFLALIISIIPMYLVMKPSMLTRREDFKILYSIIFSISIYVMNMKTFRNGMTKFLLHY